MTDEERARALWESLSRAHPSKRAEMLLSALRAVREEERERCAKIAEMKTRGAEIADAIRKGQP